MKRLGHAWRIRERVRDSVIHARQPRGVWIAKPRHLHWRGFMREHLQTIQSSVAGQIHKNINLILAHFGGNLRV